MSQIFVKRGDLSNPSKDAVIHVLATYEDNVEVDSRQHGDDAVILHLPTSAVTFDMMGGNMTLAKDWRSKFQTEMIASEASRRILDVFPEYSQRNSNSELSGYIVANGADSTKWPLAAKTRKAEIDRCWTYVNAVRARSTAMLSSGNPALDPTADAQWPSRIAPYQPL